MADAGDTLLQTMLAQARATPGPEGGPAEYFDPATTAWLPKPDIADELDRAARDALLAGADTKTGAPAGVRAAVGLAASDAQRLATLRKSYPDAEAVPLTDNFVFTDQTGKRLTYAPIGARIPTKGDLASLIPEAAMAVGGGLGLLGGGGVGSALLGAAGATAGREIAQRAAPYLFDMAPDTRGVGAQVADAGLDMAVNAALPLAAGGISRSIAQSIGGNPVRQAAMALEAKGILPPGFTERALLPGVVTGNKGLQRMESAIAQSPISGGVRQADEAMREGITTGVENMAERAAAGANIPNPEGLAGNVADIAKRATDNFLAQRTVLDDAAENAIGRGRATDLQPLRDLRSELAGELAKAPESLAARYQPALDRIDSILLDARNNGGTLPFQVIRDLRTDLGNSLNWSERFGGTDPTGIGPLRQMYGRLKDVLMDAAAAAGPSARAALVAHDDWVRAFGGPREAFAMLQDAARRPDKLATMMKTGARSDLDALGYLRHYAAKPEDLRELQAGVIQQLGMNRENAFDPVLWTRNWNATKQQARDLVFGPGGPGSLQESLGQLAAVQDAARRAGRTTGWSNTGAVMTALAGLGAGGQFLLSGDLDKAAKTGAIFAAPAAAGRLLTSPLFSRWLTGASGINPARAAQWTQHVARLGAIAEADPAIRDLVEQYRASLPATLPAPAGGGP